jgi:peptidyl-prolyl cis-trans isomerase D
MLQTIRNKAGSWFALAILFIALFSLTFFGIGDYFTTTVDTYVAKVEDREIDQARFRQEYQNWRENLRAQMGEAFDPRMFEQPGMRRQFLDQLVTREVLLEANDRLGLVVPASRLRAEIMSVPAFQVNGQFSPDSYRNFLRARRMTAAELDKRLSEDMGSRLLPMAVSGTAVVTEADVDAYLRLSEQVRDFRYVTIDEPAGPVPEEVSDEELQHFFDEHVDEYMNPETVTVEYVELTADSIEVEEPDEETLRGFYEAEIARFSTPEERLASHILVQPESQDADGQRAALARAEELVAQARAEGADFAALAREHSQDLGSRDKGGDLGWLGRGVTDPAFEEVLFQMESGTISDPVLGVDGYHIIHLREVREETRTPFEEVRGRLAADYRRNEAERLFSDRVGQLTDRVLDEPTSLVPAAEALGLEIRTSKPFTRMSGEGPFVMPSVRDAAFADEVLREGLVSEPVEVGPNHVIAMRVTDHVPAAPKPLEEVADGIRARIVAQRRADALRERVEALFADFEGGRPLEEIAGELEGEVQVADGVTRVAMVPDNRLVREVFRLRRPEGEAPVRARVQFGDSWALVELARVSDGDPAQVEQARREQVRNELQQRLGMGEAQALVEALRQGMKITIAEERLDQQQ